MIKQKRIVDCRTKNRPGEGLLIVPKELILSGSNSGSERILPPPPIKSSLRRSFAGLEALIRTFFVIQEWIIDLPLSTTTKDSFIGCLWEGLVPRIALEATLGKWGSNEERL